MHKNILRMSILLLYLGMNLYAASDRPNIVWITSEDNTAHFLNLYHPQGAKTPNIERLAANGIVFNNAISNGPVCSAARSALISGCINPRIASQFHRCSSKVPMPKDLQMYPVYFKQAGYYTANNSKEDYNVYGKKGWDESSKKATYRNRKEGQPFLQVWSNFSTHESRIHFPKENLTDVPTHHNPDSIKVFPYHPNTELLRYTYAYYLDKQKKMDAEVGELIAQLDADGVLDNTIIFYFGDNGGVLPRSKGYAYDNGVHVPLVVSFPEKYQHLMPVKQGERVEGFVNFYDFAPTILNLIGAEIPKEMDGKPFLGEDVDIVELNSRDEYFSYADRFDEKYDLVRSYRKGNLHYIRNFQPFNIDGLYNDYRYKQLAFREWYELYKRGELNSVQSQFFEARPVEMLFDLATDPHETINLANHPDYSSQLIELRTLLNNKIKDLPDLSFYPESYLAEAAFSNPTSFGIAHQRDIEQLIDIANLSYLNFKEAKIAIRQNLKDTDPWKRYWAVIVCSCFGQEALLFEELLHQMAFEDSEPLVRVRAAEFLSLVKDVDPTDVIEQVCSASNNKVEVLLALNTATLLKMKNADLVFDISKEQFPQEWTKGNGNWIMNHLNFLHNRGYIK